jgi:hypothetical protein
MAGQPAAFQLAISVLAAPPRRTEAKISAGPPPKTSTFRRLRRRASTFRSAFSLQLRDCAAGALIGLSLPAAHVACGCHMSAQQSSMPVISPNITVLRPPNRTRAPAPPSRAREAPHRGACMLVPDTSRDGRAGGAPLAPRRAPGAPKCASRPCNGT